MPSREEKSRTMSSLRHRVLPPQILLKCPKEASFCLWLLHPEPSCRPSMRFTYCLFNFMLLVCAFLVSVMSVLLNGTDLEAVSMVQ